MTALPALSVCIFHFPLFFTVMYRYVGGLVDFTGEVGRIAVMAATRRDQSQVEQALAAALTVQDALM